jgi:cell division protein FtsB
MSATVIYAVIRAVRAIIIEGIRLERGDVFASSRFASEEHFQHFRRNLRWSAFEVVKVDEKEIKNATLAGVAKVTEAQLAQLDQTHAELAAVVAQLKQTRADLDAVRKRAKDHAGMLAALTPTQLSFLPETLAQQVIAAAKAQVEARTPAAPAPDPVEVARTAALRELMTVDGIGEATAVRLHDFYHITALHRLAAVLADEKGCATLVADPEAQISEKDLEHWRRQVVQPEPTDGAKA